MIPCTHCFPDSSGIPSSGLSMAVRVLEATKDVFALILAEPQKAFFPKSLTTKLYLQSRGSMWTYQISLYKYLDEERLPRRSGLALKPSLSMSLLRLHKGFTFDFKCVTLLRRIVLLENTKAIWEAIRRINISDLKIAHFSVCLMIFGVFVRVLTVLASLCKPTSTGHTWLSALICAASAWSFMFFSSRTACGQPIGSGCLFLL